MKCVGGPLDGKDRPFMGKQIRVPKLTELPDTPLGVTSDISNEKVRYEFGIYHHNPATNQYEWGGWK